MSKNYTEEALLRVAKRQNNNKRSYLLVNPMQAKHMPISPSAALSMMSALGSELARKYPDTKLLIAFAETATAIGAAAAKCLGNDCVYLTTTRESYPEMNWIDFLEEHSHATEQRLCSNHLAEWIHNTETVILLDDELSTGKTLRNMIAQLRAGFPELSQKQIVAASVINRLTEENEKLMTSEGILTECLLKLSSDDFTEKLPEETLEAELPSYGMETSDLRTLLLPSELPNPRFGTEIGSYDEQCLKWSHFILQELESEIAAAKRILVLGTEECMFPALRLGEEIEKRYPDTAVFCHSTTRSPIGISNEPGYPISKGSRLTSIYDEKRTTYIYNLTEYRLVLVLTDTPHPCVASMKCLQAALYKSGCRNICFIFPESGK